MSKKKDKTYTVLIGCNLGCTEDDPQGTRYEIGDTVTGLSADEVKELKEAGAIADGDQ